MAAMSRQGGPDGAQMTYETILYDLAGDVATITLNRPEKMNSLSTAMRVDLIDALSLAPREARAVVLTGAGPGFCAGQDLGDAADISTLNLERVLSEHPRLQRKIDQMKVDHERLEKEVDALRLAVSLVDDGEVADEAPAVRNRAIELLGQLTRHRQRGADLIYEAYHVDIGGNA